MPRPSAMTNTASTVAVIRFALPVPPVLPSISPCAPSRDGSAPSPSQGIGERPRDLEPAPAEMGHPANVARWYGGMRGSRAEMTAEHDDEISGRQALSALRRVAATRSRALARRVVQRVKAEGDEPTTSPARDAATSTSVRPAPSADKVPPQRVGSWDLRLADHE